MAEEEKNKKVQKIIIALIVFLFMWNVILHIGLNNLNKRCYKLHKIVKAIETQVDYNESRMDDIESDVESKQLDNDLRMDDLEMYIDEKGMRIDDLEMELDY